MPRSPRRSARCPIHGRGWRGDGGGWAPSRPVGGHQPRRRRPRRCASGETVVPSDRDDVVTIERDERFTILVVDGDETLEFLVTEVRMCAQEPLSDRFDRECFVEAGEVCPIAGLDRADADRRPVAEHDVTRGHFTAEQKPLAASVVTEMSPAPKTTSRGASDRDVVGHVAWWSSARTRRSTKSGTNSRTAPPSWRRNVDARGCAAPHGGE